MNLQQGYLHAAPQQQVKDLLSVTKSFLKDEYVFQQGDEAVKYYKVVQGVVVIGSYSIEGKLIFKGLVHEGEYFGDEVVAGQTERLNFAFSLSKELVIEEYKSENFWNNEAHQMEVLRSALKRNNAIQNVMEINTTYAVEMRVKTFLKSLANDKGIRLLTGEIMVRIHIKHRELAFICNSSRQCVSAILSSFQKDGILKMDRSSFILTPDF